MHNTVARSLSDFSPAFPYPPLQMAGDRQSLVRTWRTVLGR